MEQPHTSRYPHSPLHLIKKKNQPSVYSLLKQSSHSLLNLMNNFFFHAFVISGGGIGTWLLCCHKAERGIGEVRVPYVTSYRADCQNYVFSKHFVKSGARRSKRCTFLGSSQTEERHK